jgi:hypothetical protein
VIGLILEARIKSYIRYVVCKKMVEIQSRALLAKGMPLCGSPLYFLRGGETSFVQTFAVRVLFSYTVAYKKFDDENWRATPKSFVLCM